MGEWCSGTVDFSPDSPLYSYWVEIVKGYYP